MYAILLNSHFTYYILPRALYYRYEIDNRKFQARWLARQFWPMRFCHMPYGFDWPRYECKNLYSIYGRIGFSILIFVINLHITWWIRAFDDSSNGIWSIAGIDTIRFARIRIRLFVRKVSENLQSFLCNKLLEFQLIDVKPMVHFSTWVPSCATQSMLWSLTTFQLIQI